MSSCNNNNNTCPSHGYQYDMVVIGGGSGGLACSKACAELGKKVAVLDFVKPSPIGTQWGLGGTCVNVGCIPKKLMHTATLMGEHIHDSKEYGWNVNQDQLTHNWSTMVQNVQDYIGSLNWGYRMQLRDNKVTYINSLATFKDAHTIEATDKKGQKTTITSQNFVVAVGGRPRYPNIPGAREYGITSDDLFSKMTPPGKTLIVGASYVALECAGFMAGLGYDTTVMIRSIPLRGFDQQMAELVVQYMEQHANVKFVRNCVPVKIELTSENRKLVTSETFMGEHKLGEIQDEFDTVLFAVGRDPDVHSLGLENLGMQTHRATGKIIVNDVEQTSVPNIYALGDVIQGGLELTPVAILAGRLLARRLYGGSTSKMSYDKVPTTVFTPLEYGCCGLAEETAIDLYGADNIEVYQSYFKPLEWTVSHRPDNTCYMKLICLKTENNRVLGFHILSPNAGEITQGVGVAIKMGATKEDFESTVGIHPTIAEEMTILTKTKASGEDAKKAGC